MKTKEVIQEWLVSRLAEELGIDKSAIDPRESFDSLGLSSRDAVTLSGDLEDWLTHRLSPTILWEYPTIETMSRYLAELDAGGNGKTQTFESPAPAEPRTKSLNEPIAIVGIGCRFPGASGPDEYWKLLCDERDAIRDVPADRWDNDSLYHPDPATPGKMYTRRGGFVDAIDQFDASFFGVSPREAARMDPQQRLLMETAWEALEHAGIAPDSLAGSATGVFVGISSNDYSQRQFSDVAHVDAYAGTGNAHSLAPNRISYFLDLRGPSYAVDTACSSSLVAIHNAAISLRLGECNLAIAGGVNALLSPEVNMVFSHARMMSPDGKCKTFDASADGYVRGEGCGVVILKRLADAQTDGDTVIAVIRGTAVNHDGRSNGLTAPNGLAQQAVIRQALANAGIEPGQVGYVEAHGTGTSLGDPIEVDALKAVLLPGRGRDQRCLLGSVKTNIGHLEAAAGVAGLIKTALILKHGMIPSHLNLKQVNPLIKLDNTPIEIVTSPQVWARGNDRRFAGVSSFGFGGANAHVILEEPPQQFPDSRETTESGPRRRVLALSAQTDTALKALAQRYAECLSENPSSSVADVCATANSGRASFDHRIAVVADTTHELSDRLAAYAQSGKSTGVFIGETKRSESPKIAFLFTGQGAQFAGMGRQLFELEPVFREALLECDEILQKYLTRPLLSVMHPKEGESSPIDETAFTQPSLFAFEYAMARLWMSWGIVPDFVLGHSVGEYVAACIAGAMSLPDGLRLIAERARLMQALPAGGAMAAVMSDRDTVAAVLEPYRDRVSIAAANGPKNTVVSGAGDSVDAVLKALEEKGIANRKLVVSHAFHSPLMEPMLDEFESTAARLQFDVPKIPVISNLTGKLVDSSFRYDAMYWRNHVRQAVQFADGMNALNDAGVQVLLEVGPQPVLIGMGKKCVSNNSLVWISSLKKGQEEWASVIDGVAELYVRGARFDWKRFYASANPKRVALPTYPFERKRHWLDVPRKQVSADTTAAPQPDTAPDTPVADLLYEIQWRPKSNLDRMPIRRPIDFVPEPQTIKHAVDTHAARLVEEHQLATIAGVNDALESLSLSYIVEALGQLGWNPGPGERFSAASLSASLGVVPLHARLFKRLLEILAEEGFLRADGEDFVVDKPIAAAPSTRIHAETLRAYSVSETELTMLGRCGANLANVLKGTADPLQVLFPGGSFDEAERLYEQSPFARVYNLLVQETITRALERLPKNKVVRVLEIGAGTGGTTSYVLRALPDASEYVFTDMSSMFLARAEKKFASHSCMRYALLDIESDPVTQGFSSHQFDVVVAANVLHATADLSRTLANARKLLAPGGLMILLEGTSPIRWLDLTFGLTEGWWKFTDTTLRPNHALLHPTRWMQVLRAQGFSDVVAMPPENIAGVDMTKQTVILARASADTSESESMPVVSKSSDSWMILANEVDAAKSASDCILNRGGQCAIVRTGEAFAHNANEWTIRADNASDYERVIRECGEALKRPIDRILCLPASSATDNSALHAMHASLSATLLVQSLANVRPPTPPRVYFATRNAQSVAGESTDFASASVWGIGRSLAAEHPEFWGGLIDLDAGAAASDLIDAVLSAEGEDQMALRDGTRFVARLTSCANATKAPLSRTFDANAAYLVTGGLGGIGLRVAKWMAERGAHHLLLVNRTPLPARDLWPQLEPGSDARARVDAIQSLEALGVKVYTPSCDIGDQHALDAMLRAFREESGLTIKGVVHAAGVLKNQSFINSDNDTLRAVMRPKVDGTLALHRAFADASLDFFVLFSSGTSVFGSPGQSNYAAANAFMDSLAHARRAAGLPAVSINWGPWAEVGMVADLDEQSRQNMPGVEFLRPEVGVRAFEAALLLDSPQVTVLQIDWSRFFQAFGGESPSPLLDTFAKRAARKSPAAMPQLSSSQSAGLLAKLASASASERQSQLESYLKEHLGRILMIDAASIREDANFMELGLDSLMAMELLKSIEREFRFHIYPREIFDRPNVRALAQYLAGEVERATGQVRPAADAASDAREVQKALQAGSGSLKIKASAVAPSKKIPGAVFLLSTPRAGSTLLRVMLAGHPQLFCPPELHLLPFASMKERAEALGMSYLDEGVQRAFMELKGLDADAGKRLIDEMTQQDVPIQDVYAQLQQAANGRIIVDKSPSYAADIETLERGELLFDGAKYVHLVRHPYSMIESYVRIRLDKLMGADKLDPIAVGEHVWALSNSNALRFGRQIDPSRFHIVRYEDLVSNPEAVMRRLLEFLGLPWDPNVLKPYEGKRMTDGIYAESRPTGDPRFHLHKSIESELGEVWRKIDLGRPLGGFVRRIAPEFDYELPNENIKPKSQQTPSDTLVPIKPVGSKPPLFLIHPAGGLVFPYYALIPYFDADQPCYGIQDPALEAEHVEQAKTEDMAARYVEIIRGIEPKGPYYLAGWSFGGTLAFEIAQQFLRAGDQVAMLCLIDTEIPTSRASRNKGLMHRLKMLGTQIYTVVVGAPFTLPYIRDGIYLVFATLLRRKKTGGQEGPSIREYANWAWNDALRQYFISHSEIAGVVEANSRLNMIRLSMTRRVMQLLNIHIHARDNYNAGPYPGEITVLVAKQQPKVREMWNDPTLGWERIAPGRVKAVPVPGNHVVLLARPYIDDTAAAINRCLDEAQSKQL
ncbi:MAG: SDR family NAD(P)-dependent oxidoreductase [Candidatus Hydrogenedentes bacterium]|nr:SDR family NAD(P)-dependent oxidoreductase [Candidatus Hydrogenedentota bacterium]